MSTLTLFERIGGRPGIKQLLRHFYADVRQHFEIGPLFMSHVQDWPAHLDKIADFWTAATGGPVLYRGPMPFKHLHLNLRESHFRAWLGLWQRHCRTWLAQREAEELIERAEGIGLNLRRIIANHRPRHEMDPDRNPDQTGAGAPA